MKLTFWLFHQKNEAQHNKGTPSSSFLYIVRYLKNGYNLETLCDTTLQPHLVKGSGNVFRFILCVMHGDRGFCILFHSFFVLNSFLSTNVTCYLFRCSGHRTESCLPVSVRSPFVYCVVGTVLRFTIRFLVRAEKSYALCFVDVGYALKLCVLART